MNALEQHFEQAATAADLRMLVHARVWEPDGTLGKRFEEFRTAMLARPHGMDSLAEEVADVRKGLADYLESANPWETRSRPGGLADLELGAEYLQIAHARHTSAVLVHGLAETFESAREQGLIDSTAASELTQAVSLWHNLEGYFRMTCGGAFQPEAATEEQKHIIADMCGVGGFDELSDLLPDTALRTARILDQLFAA